MPDEQQYGRRRREMTAAERYAYKSLPENLRRRKEGVEDTASRILDFLALIKEFGEEIEELGSTEYSELGSAAYDPEHVTRREQILGEEFAGELQALQSFDQVRHESIRREIGRLGKDFVKKVTQFQQLMESLYARFTQATTPFTRSKAPELEKFEKELRQRISDISYLTRQHAELVAAAQDAIAGDMEETNDEIVAEYQRAIMPYVEEYDALREEYSTISRLSFRKRREVLDKLNARADAINAVNEQYKDYTFIDFIAFELPQDEG